MNRRLKFYLIGLVIGLVVYNFYVRKKAAETATTKTEKVFPIDLSAQFDCKSIGTEDMPQTIVSLTANGKTWPIDTVAEAKVFEKADWPRHEIPTTALAACGGWFAGAGDYLYAIREGDSLNVYQGWQDEEQVEGGFHYKVVRAVKASDF